MKLVLKPGVPLLVYLVKFQCQAFIVREILVHEPVTFLCTGSVNCAEVRWIRFIPVTAVIAICHNRTCQVQQRCLKRFAVSGDTSRGNFSMRISSASYNDAGSYRCTCDGDPVSEIKLKVYVPTVIEAFEGQKVTLPCYGNTQQGVKDVKWMKAGRRLLLYTQGKTSVTTEEPSAGRFSVSAEGFPDGELSLHISPVHQTDAGVYRCLINNEAQEGEPRAVILKVEETRSTTAINGVAVVTGLLGFVLAGIIGTIVYTVKRCRRTMCMQCSLTQLV